MLGFYFLISDIQSADSQQQQQIRTHIQTHKVFFLWNLNSTGTAPYTQSVTGQVV